jgi:biotin carboxyl carrier protein
VLHKKTILLITALLVLSVGVWVASAGAFVDQKVVLSGKVLADGMAAPGSRVREGDVLLTVESITGPVPAARATTDGIVREVLVKPGDRVHSGDVAARIEPVRK